MPSTRPSTAALTVSRSAGGFGFRPTILILHLTIAGGRAVPVDFQRPVGPNRPPSWKCLNYHIPGIGGCCIQHIATLTHTSLAVDPAQEVAGGWFFE